MIGGGALAAFALVLMRDLRLSLRRRSDIANPLLFFVIIVTLFPLGLSPAPELLAPVAPGIVWVAALLATLISLDAMFRDDFEDGSLEQLLRSPYPLPLLVAAKVAAHWLVTGLPLVIVAPLLAAALFLPASAIPILAVTLLIGTPVLSLVGAIGGALTVGLRRGGLLLALIVLPLYVPVLIFGTLAIDTALAGMSVTGHLYLLGALLVLALTLAPLAAAGALRIAAS